MEKIFYDMIDDNNPEYGGKSGISQKGNYEQNNLSKTKINICCIYCDGIDFFKY